MLKDRCWPCSLQNKIMCVRPRYLLLVLFVLSSVSRIGMAQASKDSLTDTEIEEIRDHADMPAQRVIVFQKIIDTRINRIQELAAKPYEPGRAEDLHDLMRQIAGIAGELEENLETYATTHGDLRKALPKLIVAAERWTSVLKQPEKQDRYNLTRELALETVGDLRKEATELLPEQKQWFKEHPPGKETDGDQKER